MKTRRAKAPLEAARARIASRVRALRLARSWTQAELAARLHISQNRLSEIERGAGSFTAEQLLVILKLFNAPLSHFARDDEPDEVATLQNALARLGAVHLHESERVLPSERVEHVNDVVREALISREPRLVTALAPVLVRNADHVSLHAIDDRLIEAGLEARLPWLADNILDALRSELGTPLDRPWAQAYRRATVVLGTYRERVASRADRIDSLDVLDAHVRTKKSVDEIRAKRSSISHRWGILSNLQPADFAVALRSARVDR